MTGYKGLPVGSSKSEFIASASLMRRAGLALLLAAMAVIAPRAWSAPLNLSKDFPDFVVSGLSYGYTAGTGQLIVSGGVSSYTEQLGGSLQNVAVTGGVFNLTATLDSVGNVLSGSFTLTGVVRAPFPVPLYDGAAHSTGNLLQGDLTAFGWAGDSAPSTGGLIEFAFNHADGYIPDPSFPLQELGAATWGGGGMILDVTSTSLAAGTFGANALTSDWTGSGFGDVFVPVPAAAWLFGSALLALFGWRSRAAGA